jgi:hypothetical protein
MKAYYRLCIVLLAYLTVLPVYAQWSDNPAINTPICTYSGDQHQPFAVPDGRGGAIISWLDERGDYTFLYAQRIDSAGYSLWGTDGSLISVTQWKTSMLLPMAMDVGYDGSALICHLETDPDPYDYSKNIFAQRIGPDGNRLWGQYGVYVGNGSKVVMGLDISGDGQGGSYVTYCSSWNQYAVFLSHITPQGVIDCSDINIAGSGGTEGGFNATLASDGQGGVYIAWEHWNDVDIGNADIHLNRFVGSQAWATGEKVICDALKNQVDPQIIGDGIGGAIIVWRDSRGTDKDIYAQHISSSGEIQWNPNGMAVCTAEGHQEYPKICEDGLGGVLIAWPDQRPGAAGIYAQKIDHSGTAVWEQNGLPVYTLPTVGAEMAILSDGDGGAFIVYQDSRLGNWDLFIYRVNSDGTTDWPSTGLPVTTAGGTQLYPAMVNDGEGNAIVVWKDRRGTDANIYAQWIKKNGYPMTSVRKINHEMLDSFTVYHNYPNPFNSATQIRYGLPHSCCVRLLVFDALGREIVYLVDEYQEQGYRTIELDLTGFPSGIYFYQIRAGDYQETRKMLLLK